MHNTPYCTNTQEKQSAVYSQPEPQEKIKIITIDGPAGSGKSTVAQLVCKHIGWVHVNTGAIYRCFALLLEEAGCSLEDLDVMNKITEHLEAYYLQDAQTGDIFIKDRNVTQLIRQAYISERTSLIAQNAFIRQKLLPLQRRTALSCGGAVVDGRDMGTIVFPDAPIKVYLTAAPEERARRRILEAQARGEYLDFEAVVKEIYERDARDASRSVAPMRPAEDAIILDSTKLAATEVAEIIIQEAYKQGLVVFAQKGTEHDRNSTSEF